MRGGSFSLYIAHVFFSVYSFATMLKCSWTDPGIFPKNLLPVNKIPRELHYNVPENVYSVKNLSYDYYPEYIIGKEILIGQTCTESQGKDENIKNNPDNPQLSDNILDDSNKQENFKEDAKNEKTTDLNQMAIDVDAESLHHSTTSTERTLVTDLSTKGHSINSSSNSRSYTLKYCHTCQIFRPPRASHCAQCNNCVDGFDHHCPWLSNCIGIRNYKFFMVYVVVTLITGILTIAYSTKVVVSLAKTKSPFQNYLLPGFLTLTVSGIVIYFIALFIRHIRLIVLVRTTKEDIKGIRYGKNEIGTWSNVVGLFCAPQPTRYIQWKSIANRIGPNATKSEF